MFHTVTLGCGTVANMDAPQCRFEGCDRPARAKGLCDGHYRQQRAGRELAPLRHMTSPGMPLVGRMAIYTDRRGKNECWPWLAGHDKDGYGEVSTGGSGNHRRAHVVAWELANDRKCPPGMVVMHTCDHPWCVNYGHLQLGTNLDNIRDRDQKGRMARGEASSRSKLTAAQVKAIRRAWKRGASAPEMATEYGVSVVSIYNIANRKTWTHI